MFKLAITVMSSAVIGLFFATLCKAEPETSTLSVPQTSIVQRMIDSSLRENLKPIVDRLEDLDRRIRLLQPSSPSERDSPCPGPLCQPDSSRDYDRGSPCWPSKCAARDKSPCWPSNCEARDKSPCWSSNCEGQEKSPCWPSTCELMRDRGSRCWPSGCAASRDRNWLCPGGCRHEKPRNININIYKHVYIHKHIYKHIYWHPVYRPCWDECGW